MTREEAIVYFESLLKRFEEMHETETSYWGKVHTETTIEAIRTALTALQPVSREQVEKVWRECPECKPRCGLCVHMGQWDKHGKPYVCEKCVGFSNFESDQKFCECCGRPLTDEAVEMVMERWEELNVAGNQ